MLSFLLFAGAIHVNIQKLKARLASVITFAAIATVISAFTAAALLYAVTVWLSIPVKFCTLPFIWLFAADLTQYQQHIRKSLAVSKQCC